MVIEGHFRFATTEQVLSGTSDVASTNVHDAGSAKLLFGGYSQRPPTLVIEAEWVSDGGSPTIRGRLVGAADAVLTGTPIIIADTGVISLADDGTAFAAGHIYARRYLPLLGQRIAKRYYGVMFTQGGTTPVFHVKAYITPDAQSQDQYIKAAVP